MMETEPDKPTNQKDDEFEVAESLDDLNLDFTSGSGSTEKKTHEDEQLPSIDDFTIDRQSSANVKRVVADHWYTQVLGQELGPFPFDELVNMVLGGDIGPKDMIRHQVHGQWIAAGDIGGLFPEIDDSAEDDDFELGSNVHVRQHDESAEADSPNVRVVGGEINRVHREAQEMRAKRNQAPPPPATVDDDPIEPLEENLEIDEAPPEPTPEELEAARKKIIADRLNSWLDDRVETPPEPVVEDDDEPATPAYTPPAASAVPVQTPRPTYTPPPPRPMPTKPKVKSGGGESIFSKIGGMFGGVSAPDVSVDPKHMIILGVIVLVGALFYLPSLIGGTNDEAIYQRFKEIYGQIQQHRSSNPGAIQAMKQDVVPEIEETVQKLLDDGAGAKKPIKQQLMWIGKNCLIPLIDSPGTEPGPLDTRIETHFSTIDSLKK